MSTLPDLGLTHSHRKKSVWPTGIARLGANWCGPKKTDGWRESSEGKVIWEESLVYLLGEVQGARVSLCFFVFFVFSCFLWKLFYVWVGVAVN